MSFSIVLPIWQALQERFHKTVKALPEQDLSLRLGSSSIESMLRHNAEVEFIFAEWFFGKSIPEEMKKFVKRGEDGDDTLLTKDELVDLLAASNSHLIEAMRELPEEAWHNRVETSMGASTPLEAVGRLMYHTGIHSGQISLIQKNARS
ncbi:DinB family protein [Cohnella mopanensis]|uniref:DinB family protein n=1 Tax=Cohnella mopanensis TaxID=2911966 RepID=UPI001EF81A23|nr:DinB family protein [Cohnella mopanensis]